MLKLKLQYFGHLMQRADSLEKTLMLGKIEGRRRRGRQRMRWLDGITKSMDMSLSKLQDPPSIRVFSNESTLLMRWPGYWSFSFSIIPSKEIPGLISLQSKGLSRVFSNTTVQKHQFFGTQLSSQSNSHIHT